MPHLDFVSMLGYTNNAYSYLDVFGNPSNIILTDNPSYTVLDFKKIFPVFRISNSEETGEDEIPFAVFNLFLSMANGAIKEKRYNTNWKYFMSLFIAHHLTLYLMASSGTPGAKDAIKNSIPGIGIAQSKSVDGLSISYEIINPATSLSSYGTWNLTTYGQQLVTLVKPYGHSGLWVNW